jgi:hypothetical protein
VKEGMAAMLVGRVGVRSVSSEVLAEPFMTCLVVLGSRSSWGSNGAVCGWE